eukprot:537599-Alexandrium_andersonii.AAC.1
MSAICAARPATCPSLVRSNRPSSQTRRLRIECHPDCTCPGPQTARAQAPKQVVGARASKTAKFLHARVVN